jgi:hypothetical protein
MCPAMRVKSKNRWFFENQRFCIWTFHAVYMELGTFLIGMSKAVKQMV